MSVPLFSLRSTPVMMYSARVDRYLPTNTRLQLDGVNTNWGRVTLAHVANLVKRRMLGATTVARNPVGNTHEARSFARRVFVLSLPKPA